MTWSQNSQIISAQLLLHVHQRSSAMLPRYRCQRDDILNNVKGVLGLLTLNQTKVDRLDGSRS